MSGDAGTLASGKKDACTLLTRAEIEAVQGEPVKETKASVQVNGEMLVSECLFHTTNFPKSVSVALAVPASAKHSALAPRKFWQRQFHSTDVKEEESRVAGKEAPAGGEEEESKARAIGGIGEEAYWVGNPVAGALYVLHGNVFLRISVGGVREESARIKKTKILARAIVKRL